MVQERFSSFLEQGSLAAFLTRLESNGFTFMFGPFWKQMLVFGPFWKQMFGLLLDMTHFKIRSSSTGQNPEKLSSLMFYNNVHP